MTALIAALLATATFASTHPAWMVGTWGDSRDDCGSDHSVTYERNGRYSLMDETGYWRIEGDRLIETMTDPGGTGDPAERGKPWIVRFKRTAPTILRITAPYAGKMVKCRTG